jgi:uncharacterized lipoprotein YbaY
MKSMMPLLAISILAACALVGCNQSEPANSAGVQPTNASVADTNGMTGTITNMPSSTNMPASTNK